MTAAKATGYSSNMQTDSDDVSGSSGNKLLGDAGARGNKRAANEPPSFFCASLAECLVESRQLAETARP